jgi:hypothetical protein
MQYRGTRSRMLALLALLAIGYASRVTGQISVSYIGPPDDLTDLAKKADAVVRVRVGESETRDFVAPLTRPPVLDTATVYQVLVLEVLKRGTSLLIQEGLPLEVFKEGGRMEDGPARANRQFEGLKRNKEYLLFLRWNEALQQYWIAYGPHGAYSERAGRAVAEAESGLSKQFENTTWPDFLAAVRRAVEGSR